MKLLHDNGYSEEEKLAYRDIIYVNIVQSMRTILEAMEKREIPLGDTNNELHKQVIMGLPSQMEVKTLPVEISEAIAKLWLDSGIQACYARANEYQLNDSAS